MSKRTRNAIGTLDTDPDEEIEVDVSAISTPLGGSITYEECTSKRTKTTGVLATIESRPNTVTMASLLRTQPVVDGTPKESPQETKRRKQVCIC